MGSLLCGLEREKRFVKVHLHCVFRNLKKDKRNVDVSPPGNISADAHGIKVEGSTVIQKGFRVKTIVDA